MSDEYAGRNPIDGRWLKGNPGGTGNPYHKRAHALRKAINDCATPEQVQTVITKLFDFATAGDVQACKLWLEYTVGKPVQGVEITGGDGDPLRVDMATITSVILGVLGDDPERRQKMAAALRRLSQSSAHSSEEPTDGPGDGIGCEG